MKYLTLTFALLLMVGCSSSGEESNMTDAPISKTSKEYSKKDLFVKVTFSDGPLKGTHKFIKDKSGAISSLQVTYSDETSKNERQRNTSSLRSAALISEDGKLRMAFLNRYFSGGITKGKHEPYFIINSSKEKECSKFQILDAADNYDFSRMQSDNNSCNSVEIIGFSDWKEGTIYNRRAVEGRFTDSFDLLFRGKNGKQDVKLSCDILVEFNVVQQKLKTK